MKTKSTKQDRQAKPAVQLKDIKPKKNPAAGRSDQGWGVWETNPAKILAGG